MDAFFRACWLTLGVLAFLWYVGMPEPHHYVPVGFTTDHDMILMDQNTGDLVVRTVPVSPPAVVEQ